MAGQAWWRQGSGRVERPRMTAACVVMMVLIYSLTEALPNMRSALIRYSLFGFKMNPVDCFTGLWLHHDLAHLAVTVVFLWVIGWNLERRIGSRMLLVVFLIAGYAANVCHAVLAPPDSRIGMVGGSGAVSFLLAGYLVLYAPQPIQVRLGAGLIKVAFALPPFIVIGDWIGMQAVYGGTETVTGIRLFYAHGGGLILGYLSAWWLRYGRQIKQKDALAE